MSQVTVTKIVEGQSHIVIKVDIVGDGTGELNNTVILSPSDLNPPFPNNVPAFCLMQMWYGMVWFDFSLKAGTVTPQPFFTVARDCDSHIDFRSFGGIYDPNVYSAPPSDDNGKLTISTNGLVLNGRGTIIIELRKTNKVSVSP